MKCLLNLLFLLVVLLPLNAFAASAAEGCAKIVDDINTLLQDKVAACVPVITENNRPDILVSATEPLLTKGESMRKTWIMAVVGAVGYEVQNMQLDINRVITTDSTLIKSQSYYYLFAKDCVNIRMQLASHLIEVNDAYDRARNLIKDYTEDMD